MRSSQVAAKAGVSTETLRYYERRGLLREPVRLASGYRSYGADAVLTVRFVKRAQGLGFSLQEIAQLLHLAAGGPDNCDAARALALEKIAQLEEKIVALGAMSHSLGQLVATCERARTKRICPLLDAIENPDDVGGRSHE